MNVCILPTYREPDKADGGIRRVTEAQERYLPEHGITVQAEPDGADLIACHGTLWEERPGVPVVSHNHGCYWSEYNWDATWAERANGAIVDALIRADAVTAPSEWVAHALSYGLTFRPAVLHHGIEPDEWTHDGGHAGYVLWNKARMDAVSDPAAVEALARRLSDVPFVTTFGGGKQSNVHVTGAMPLSEMKPLIQRAGVYLATVRETFGIGTLEALASGVPVVGWDFGGQAEIIQQGETGYLVPVGDEDTLADAVQQALAERERLSANAREDVQARWTWKVAIARYAALYRQVLDLRQLQARGFRVSVVITSYDLNRYLPDAIQSALRQGPGVEVIVIDDAGQEDASEVCRLFDAEVLRCYRLERNRGLSGARNEGAKLATGRYLLFLDADDMLPDGAAAALADVLDKDRGLHIAFGALETMREDGSDIQRNPWPAGFDYRLQMAHLNQSPYGALWRREAFLRTGGYRDRDWRAEDAALWCRAIGFGLRAAQVTDQPTLRYRWRGDSKSQQESRAHQDRDGDWTAWYPWRIGAASGPEGGESIKRGVQFIPGRMPFAAPRPKTRHAWPISHRQEPLISVVIPVGPGHAQYLPDALDSLVAQTFGNWEAIVVNDSGEPIDIAAWPWARLIDTEGRQGAGAARNIGLTAVRAPLVLWLDADDVLLPEAMPYLLRAYATGRASYVYGDTLFWLADQQWDSPHERRDAADYDQMFALSHGYEEGKRGLHGVTALVETAAARDVEGFDVEMPGWEDWEFFLRLAADGYCGRRVAIPTILYRYHTGYRRNAAFADADRLRAAIGRRYSGYVTGERMARRCCGGNAQIKATVEAALEPAAAQEASMAMAGPPIANGHVRMKYVGPLTGEHSIVGRPSLTIYRVGNNPFNAVFTAKREDAEFLMSLGDFQVIR